MSGAYWISWYSEASADTFELHSPWWTSGYAFDPDRDILVAAVRASDEAEAWAIIEGAYDNPGGVYERRFCDVLPESVPPFSDRFPQAEWMAWEPDRTCACPEHTAAGSSASGTPRTEEATG